jgi:hypothetical protein
VHVPALTVARFSQQYQLSEQVLDLLNREGFETPKSPYLELGDADAILVKLGFCYILSQGQMTGCRPVVQKLVTGRKYRMDIG